MNALIILAILLAGAGASMLTAVGTKQFKGKGMARNFSLIFGIVFLAYGLVSLGGQAGLYTIPGTAGSFFLTASVPSGSNGEIVCPAGTTLKSGVCVSTTGGGANYQPTASYSSKDKYATTSIVGTSYYKVNVNGATTTAYSNVNVGDQITYWVDNSTYWIKPVIKGAVQGVNSFEALGWANASATVTLYDPVNRQSTTTGAYNTSLGANGQASVEITYDGTAKGSSGPFGGNMVFEYNSTISSVICTGDDLLSNNPYHLTYTTSATTHTFKSWAYGSSLDDGSGKPRRIDCEITNGAIAVGDEAPYYVKFIPANYYVTNDGDIVLDIEKYANGDTTRVGSVINSPSATGYFGA